MEPEAMDSNYEIEPFILFWRCIQVKDLPIGASQNSRFPLKKSQLLIHTEVLKI